MEGPVSWWFKCITLILVLDLTVVGVTAWVVVKLIRHFI